MRNRDLPTYPVRVAKEWKTMNYLRNPQKNGKMLFQLGALRTHIYCGRFHDTRSLFGYATVKMAAEIEMPCTIDIPTKDFGVPDVVTFKRGLVKGISAIQLGLPLYVGCWGGIGRTGLYLAGMAKVMAGYREKMHRTRLDPLLYVRNQYMEDAVETRKQEQFILDLDVTDIVDWWHGTQRLMNFADDVVEGFVLEEGWEDLPMGLWDKPESVGYDLGSDVEVNLSVPEEWLPIDDYDERLEALERKVSMLIDAEVLDMLSPPLERVEAYKPWWRRLFRRGH
jgi:hypothetical protein